MPDLSDMLEFIDVALKLPEYSILELLLGKFDIFETSDCLRKAIYGGFPRAMLVCLRVLHLRHGELNPLTSAVLRKHHEVLKLVLQDKLPNEMEFLAEGFKAVVTSKTSKMLLCLQSKD